jgi:ATP-binding cassette subfamily B protein
VILHTNGYFQSKVIKRLYDFSFSKILKHSYGFFSNNFSGSIIAKSKRFSKSFETFLDIVIYSIYFSLITFIGILVVLFISAPVFGYIFLVWSLIFTLITILFIKRKIKYDLLEAEADSNVTASLSDSIMNILNIKIFSSSFYEKMNLKK